MSATICILTLLMAGAAKAGSDVEAPPARDIVPGVLAKMDAYLRDIANLISHETALQFSQYGGVPTRARRVESDVRVVDGAEERSNISSGGKIYRRIADVAGPWSDGSLATVVAVTRKALARDTGAARVRSIFYAAEWRYEVSLPLTAGTEGWTLHSGNKSAAIPFTAKVYLSADNGQLLEVVWDTSGLRIPGNNGIQRLLWKVTFEQLTIAGRTFTVPGNSLYQVSYSPEIDRTDWAETRYSGFQRFGAQAEIAADAEGSADEDDPGN